MGLPDRFIGISTLVLTLGALGGCGAEPQARSSASPPPVTVAPLSNGSGPAMQGRPVSAPSDSLPISGFRGMVEAVAKEIASAPAFQDAASAPTVALGEFHNKTALRLDRAAALEPIRAETIRFSGGKVRFRDDAAYAAIVDERARQSPVAATAERFGWRSAGTSLQFEQKSAVDGRVAEARILLSGSVFQFHDRDPFRTDWGMTYHQFHFRLVEVRSGLILWEKVVGLVTEGAIVAPPEKAARMGDGEGARRAGFAGRLSR